jgi:hypothetical protein
LTGACEGERTPAKQERVRCLLAERDTMAATVARLARNAHVDFRELGLLAVGVARCDPDRAFDPWDKFEIDLRDLGVPEPPEPPEPPDRR